MKKIIALIALFIFSHPALAMKALAAKQKQVAEQLKSAPRPQPVDVEGYAQALFDLQEFVFDNVTGSDFSTQWNTKLAAFNALKKPSEDTIIQNMLNMSYVTKLEQPEALMSRVFQNVQSSISNESQWSNAFNAVLNLAKIIRTKNQSAQKYNDTIKKYFQTYAQKALDMAKKIAFDKYALPYYEETKGITAIEEMTGGRVQTLRELNWTDNMIDRAERARDQAQQQAAETQKKEAEKKEKLGKTTPSSEAGPSDKSGVKKGPIDTKPREKGKILESGTIVSSQAAQKIRAQREAEKMVAQENIKKLSDDDFIALVLDRVQKLPKNLAIYDLTIEVSKKKQEKEKEKEANKKLKDALNELDAIQERYSQIYEKNKTNESVKMITKILKTGVPKVMNKMMEDALAFMESEDNLQDALDILDIYIKEDAQAALKKAASKEEKELINAEIKLLQEEKNKLEALLKNPTQENILAYENKLLEKLDALTKELYVASDKKKQAAINEQIRRLRARAPHLLAAAEMRRENNISFSPTAIRAYILAKKGEHVRRPAQ